MHEHEIQIVEALYRCSYVPGSKAKKFVRTIYERDRKKRLTNGQRRYLWAVAFSWRRQLPRDLAERAHFYSKGVGIYGAVRG